VEKQLSKIINERVALEDRQKELKNALLTNNDTVNRKKDVIMLLKDLKEKTSGEVTWETKREIIKLLVREVLVQTTHSDDRDEAEVRLLVKFVFSQVLNHTDKREDNNLGEIMFMRSIGQHAEMTVGNTPAERIRWSRMQKGWLIKTLSVKVRITPVI
jgi:hypothetical protein